MNEAAVLEVDGPAPLPDVPTLLEAELAPDDVAAWAASVTPGSAVMKPLAALDPRKLSHAGRVDALAALEKHLGWVQAQQHRLLAVLAADPAVATPAGEPDRQWTREDVASALRLSPLTAADRLELATALTRLPATLELLARGQISTHHARHLAQTVLSLDDATATAVETAVLANAPTQSLATFRRSLRHAVLTAAPQPAEERHAEAVTQRRVVRTPVADGMSEISILLPDPGATTIMTAINALARRCRPQDERSADQRRADAAIQLALNTLTGQRTSELPSEHGLHPTVQVTVALSTLLGLDQQPGDLTGSGPIPATVARHIAADPTGTWRRLITDPTGHLLDYGRNTYRPPHDLTQHIIARDRTCRFPNCNHPARHCELDHQQPWQHGGHTNQANLTTLCRRHHHAKHDAGWTPQRQPDNTIHWTAPTGHTYLKPAATYPIDHTTDPRPQPESDETDPDPPPY